MENIGSTDEQSVFRGDRAIIEISECSARPSLYPGTRTNSIDRRGDSQGETRSFESLEKRIGRQLRFFSRVDSRDDEQSV